MQEPSSLWLLEQRRVVFGFELIEKDSGCRTREIQRIHPRSLAMTFFKALEVFPSAFCKQASEL